MRCGFSPWVGSPGGGHDNPLQRSLAGYSPWGHKESDKTEVTLHASRDSRSTYNLDINKKIIPLRF